MSRGFGAHPPAAAGLAAAGLAAFAIEVALSLLGVKSDGQPRPQRFDFEALGSVPGEPFGPPGGWLRD